MNQDNSYNTENNEILQQQQNTNQELIQEQVETFQNVNDKDQNIKNDENQEKQLDQKVSFDNNQVNNSPISSQEKINDENVSLNNKKQILVKQIQDQEKTEKQEQKDLNSDQMMRSALDFKIEIEVEGNCQSALHISELFLQSQSNSSNSSLANPQCPTNTQNFLQSQNQDDINSQAQFDILQNRSPIHEQNYQSPYSINKNSQLEVYDQQPFPDIPSIPKSLHDDSFLMELEDPHEESIKNNQFIPDNLTQKNQILNSSESNISTPDSEQKIINERSNFEIKEVYEFNHDQKSQEIQSVDQFMQSENFDNYTEQNWIKILNEFLFQNSFVKNIQDLQINQTINHDQLEIHLNDHQEFILYKFLNLDNIKVESIIKSIKNIQSIKLLKIYSNFYVKKQKQETSQIINENFLTINEYDKANEVVKYNGMKKMFMGQIVTIQDDGEYQEMQQYEYKNDDNDQKIKDQTRIRNFEDQRDQIDKKEPEQIEYPDAKIRNQYERIIDFDWYPLDKFRAKLYTLDQEGRWHDRGTGNFKIEHVGYQQYKMTLLQEQDNQIDLLKNEIIEPHITFHRQRETIITWSDKQRELDLAVSFQNNAGAQYTWNKICQILDVDPDQNTQDSQNQDEEAEEFSQITLESLPRLADELKNVQTIDNEAKQEICEHFLQNEAQKLIKLGELFQECENDLKEKPKIAEEYLQNFFHIYKGLIQLNDERLLEILMSDKFYLDTFGGLEWDPEALEEIQDISSLKFQQQFQQEPEFESLPQKDKNEIQEETLQPEEELEEKQVNKIIQEKINKEDIHMKDEQLNSEQERSEYLKQQNLLLENQEKKFQFQTDNQENIFEQNQKDDLNISESDNQNKIEQISQLEMEEEKQNKFVQKYFTSLKYREFLSQTVKFKKVIEFKQNKKYQNNSDMKNNYYNTSVNNQTNELHLFFDIEEKIHINYRLQFLKDTVMARYIDDTALKIINQLIQSNNKDIVSEIFGLNHQNDAYSVQNTLNNSIKTNQQNTYWGPFNSNSKSIKDQIIEKIKQKSNIQEKFQAIEFMTELCQILKGFQYQQGFIGGQNPNFQFNSGPVVFNSRVIIDQLNHVNLIGLLAESLAIFVPTSETLDAHLNYYQNSNASYQIQLNEYKKNLIDIYKEQNPSMENSIIEDLLEFIKERNEQITQAELQLDMHAITRVDKMKINSMEIVISFYQNNHIPMNEITKFVMGEEQKQRGLPFLNNLVSHLIYSPEQGIKIQICDFFKSFLDPDQGQLNNFSSKEQLYKSILRRFVLFLKQFKQDQLDISNQQQFNKNQYCRFKQLEYSSYLIMQILNKVVSEHRYPFKTFMIQNEVIQNVGELQQINSKLINIEIIKFYKCLLKSKDPSYIQMITQKNLFNPVLDIFELNFQEQNPPMILSCIRDLFENIFRMSMGKSHINQNELYNQKLVDYLIRINQKSKNIIFNQKYKSIFQKYKLQDIFQNEDGENFIIDENGRKNNQQNSSPQPDRESDLNVVSPVSPGSDYSDSDLGSQNGNDNDDFGIQFKNANSSQQIGPMGQIAMQQKQQNHYIIGKRHQNTSQISNINGYNKNKATYIGGFGNDFRRLDQCITQRKNKIYEEQLNNNNKQFKKNEQQLQKDDDLYKSEQNQVSDQRFEEQSKNQISEYRANYNVNNLTFGEQNDENEKQSEQNKNKNIDVLNQYMHYPLSDEDEQQINGGLSPIGLIKSSNNLNQSQSDYDKLKVDSYFNKFHHNKNNSQQGQSNQLDNSEFLLDLLDEPENELYNENQMDKFSQNKDLIIVSGDDSKNNNEINEIKSIIEEEKFENIERIELEKENIIIEDDSKIGLESHKENNDSIDIEESSIKHQKIIENKLKQSRQSLSENVQYSESSQLSQNSPPQFLINQSNKNSASKDSQPFEQISCTSSDHLCHIIDDKELVQDMGIFNIDLSQSYKRLSTDQIDFYKGKQNKSAAIQQTHFSSKSDSGKFKSQVLKSIKNEVKIINTIDEMRDSEEEIESADDIDLNNKQQIIGYKRSIDGQTGQINDSQLDNVQKNLEQDPINYPDSKRQKTI